MAGLSSLDKHLILVVQGLELGYAANAARSHRSNFRKRRWKDANNRGGCFFSVLNLLVIAEHTQAGWCSSEQHREAHEMLVLFCSPICSTPCER